jgi:hypothetical protein
MELHATAAVAATAAAGQLLLRTGPLQPLTLEGLEDDARQLLGISRGRHIFAAASAKSKKRC